MPRLMLVYVRMSVCILDSELCGGSVRRSSHGCSEMKHRRSYCRFGGGERGGGFRLSVLNMKNSEDHLKGDCRQLSAVCRHFPKGLPAA